jgi:hypothetical protein
MVETKFAQSGKSVSAQEPAVQGCEAVLQCSGGVNVRERAGFSYKYLGSLASPAMTGGCHREE